MTAAAAASWMVWGEATRIESAPCPANGSASCREALTLDGRWAAAKKEWGASNVVWRTFKASVPAEWKGRRVRVEIPGALHKCDAVVFVNGEKAGDILRPGFEGVEATRLVKFGAENEIMFCITESGAETARGETKTVTKLHHAKMGPAGDNPKLAAYPDAFISDVFANTSWRNKRCDFEVEIDGGENLAQRRKDAEILVEVLDAASNVVWKGESSIQLNTGRKVYVLTMPWDDKIVAWELGRPALYTAKISLCASASLRDDASIRFGFREVWREGKEIMMNGHKAHLRPCFPMGCRSAVGYAFLSGIGYNVVFGGHSNDAVGQTNVAAFDASDEAGMGRMATVGAYDTLGADLFHKDPAMREEFRRFTRVLDRRLRNHPSLIVGILGNMTKADQGFSPATVGQRKASGDRAEQIDLARDIHRETNPNIVYMSHADGAVADIDSGNVYLCWTPIQEQEEFLCRWAATGTMPWCSVEWLAPYGGDWFKTGVFLGTEYLAAIYGDRAYAEESADALSGVAEATSGKGSTGHGSKEGKSLRDEKLHLWRDLCRELTWRSNSRWRAFGTAVCNMWFDTSGYGLPPSYDGSRFAIYSHLSEEELEGGGKKPSWASWLYDVRRLGNQDFCGFIGGAPDFADRTHAYYAGEKIEKQLVMIWDGAPAGPDHRAGRFKAEWKVEGTDGTQKTEGTVGTASVSLSSLLSLSSHSSQVIPQGEQARVPISFVAPDVKERTPFKITATFTGEGIEPFTDTFDFEVWPKEGKCKVESEKCKVVELIDPSGEGGKVLDALGVKYRKTENVADIPADATHIVIGRDALDRMQIDSLAPRIEEGLRVFVMRQTPDTWRKMGFRVQDLMLRDVFARDAALAPLPQDALRYWRGTPDYPNAPFGKVMSHATQRGPRGTRRHTVAGLMLQTPEREGYIPMIVGGFDLDYAALLRFEAGGDITYCTLDFEGRIGVCPAATETAKAVFGEFLGLFSNRDCRNCSQITNTNSTRSTRLDNHDGTAKSRELIVCDEVRAKAEGFVIGSETNILRAAVPCCAAFRGVGPGDVRWPSGLTIKPLRGEGATPDGAFAVKRVGGKMLVFSQVPEGQFAARAAKRDYEKEMPAANAERLDEGRVRRLYARLRTNLNSQLANANSDKVGENSSSSRKEEKTTLQLQLKTPTKNNLVNPVRKSLCDSASLRELKKALHKSGAAEFEPLPAMHLLGPFSAGKDDSKLMLDTVWSEKGETMAIQGDFDPNHEFPLPQGGTANWRPMLAPNAEGVFDFAAVQPVASFPVTYAICHVERKAAGDAMLKLGGDWRFKVWCNGEEVFRTESGARIPRFELKVPLKAGDNVLAFKVGAGSGGHKLIALLAPEREPTEAGGLRFDANENAELDSMTLYDDDVPGFDPYEFHFW